LDDADLRAQAFLLFSNPHLSKSSPDMSDLTVLTAKLAALGDLSSTEVGEAAQSLGNPDVPDALKAAFLVAFSDKGESPSEIAAFASVFRNLAVNPGLEAWAPSAIDIVGTGGDHMGGFNVSTMVTLVLACAGVPVMKHGNRGVTSKCGSADLLGAMGYNLAASPEQLRQALQQLGYVFLFAPNFHPAFKHIAPVRKELAASGRRTIFNFLGPLINPGRPAHALLGAFSERWVITLADTMGQMDMRAGLAVAGMVDADHGIDELTTATVNRVRGFGRLAGVDGRWQGKEFGFPLAPFSEICGGDVATNLGIIDAILDGRGPRGLVDTIIFNAAVALWIVGRNAAIQDGVEPARQLLLGGAVKKKISDTREFFNS
jgi:anthranilate phosphoribosyltransferase